MTEPQAIARTTETSQALATIKTSTDLAQVAELEEILLGLKEPPEIEEDPEEIAREIIAQILASETEAEVEAFGEATGWSGLCRRFVERTGKPIQDGVPVALDGYFRWRSSEYEEGAPVYYIVPATRLDNGEHIVLTTGSYNILAQLTAWARLQAEGKMQLAGKIVLATERDKKTHRGYYPMWLVTPEAAKREFETDTKEPEAAKAK